MDVQIPNNLVFTLKTEKIGILIKVGVFLSQKS